MPPPEPPWNPRRGFRDSGDGREEPGRARREGDRSRPPEEASGRRRAFAPGVGGFSEDFSGDRQGALFSSAQLRRLVLAEIDRASRQRYALGCLRLAVDRLDSLQDIYGLDARREISGSLLAFLARDLRSSDFVGSLTDSSVLVLLPHISPASLRAISQRILRGVRKLAFESGRKRIHVTLSIGVGFARGEDRAALHQVYDQAQAGLERALSHGGDRAVEIEPQPPALAEPPPAPAAAAPAPPSAPSAPPLDPEILLRTVRQALAEHQHTLTRLVESRAAPAPVGGDARQMELLERRVAKLAGELERYQGELQRLGPASAEPQTGIRSQGKQDRGAGGDQSRMSLMGEIFRANVALREALLASSQAIEPERTEPPST
jgi:diguanylate cyclase (GGDEF)-like protein